MVARVILYYKITSPKAINYYFPAENLKIDFDFERADVGIGPYGIIVWLYDKLKFEARSATKLPGGEPGSGRTY